VSNSQEAADSKWKGLCKVGGVAPQIALLIYIIEAIIYVIKPSPTTAIGWFMLFQTNRVLAFIESAFFDAVAVALLGPMFLAIYFVLRRAENTWVTIATPLAFAGMAAYLATNTSYSLLAVSDQYAVATTDAQRAIFLQQGQALVAMNPGLFYSVGYLFIAIAGVMISFAMLRGRVFHKVIALVGSLGNILILCFYIYWVFAPSGFNGAYGNFYGSTILPNVLLGGGVFLTFVWWVLTGIKLYQIGRHEKRTLTNTNTTI
jgi:hypothetical protein